MTAYSELAREIVAAKREDRSSEHTATVLRKERGSYWVRIPGGADQTPVADSTVDVKPGETVTVLITSGRAHIKGSTSSPAISAAATREMMVPIATAASMAETYAVAAQNEAVAASNSAAQAASAAEQAGESAEEAIESAATAYEAAVEAKQTADGIAATAQQAAADAARALSSAVDANAYAMGAHMGLSEVERVVGTLNWISEHGEYVATSDRAIDPTKVYYTRTGSGTEGSPYVYTQVTDPTVESIGSYYELVIDESVQNYIASHLSQTDYGLDLMVDGSDSRIHIGSVDGSNAVGTYVIDSAGMVVASFASNGVVVGAVTGIHTEMRGGRLSFMAKGYHLPDSMTGVTSDDVLPGEVAYIAVNESTNESMLHMTRAKVMKGLVFGKWQWKARDNGNMALMWVGE